MQEEGLLDVEKSPIKFGGRARVSKNTLNELGIDNGDQVVVSSESKDILVTIFSDDLLDDRVIRLREDDRKKLDVEEGQTVKIARHKKLLKGDFLDNLL